MLDDVQKKLMNLVNSTEGKVDKYALPFYFYVFYEDYFYDKISTLDVFMWLGFKKIFFLYSDDI